MQEEQKKNNKKNKNNKTETKQNIKNNNKITTQFLACTTLDCRREECPLTSGVLSITFMVCINKKLERYKLIISVLMWH